MAFEAESNVGARIPRRFSFLFITGVLILAGMLHLGGALLATLFAYLALEKLHFSKSKRKWLSIVLFLVVVLGLAYALGYVIKEAVQNLPEVAEKAIPSIIEFARQHKIELPFTDYDSLKEAAVTAAKSQVHYLGSFFRAARGAGAEFILVVIGVIVAINLFIRPELELGSGEGPAHQNLYTLCCDHVVERFRIFYSSFATVMGAQIIISAINAVLTAIFAFSVHLPDKVVVIGLTFVFGLVPIIGNLISNTIVVGIAITVSPRMGLIALGFLIVIHKLEYLLNSKIVGDRIRNPLWLTLLALIIGEKLMGVPGMILSPVVLHYIKLESAAIRVAHPVNQTEVSVEPGAKVTLPPR